MRLDHQFRSAQKNLDAQFEKTMPQAVVFALGVGNVITDMTKIEQGDLIGADISDSHALLIFDFLHQPVVVHDAKFRNAAKTPGRRPQSDSMMKAFFKFGLVQDCGSTAKHARCYEVSPSTGG